jgi:hypothetical protein
MTLKAKIQALAAAVQGFLTAVVSTLVLTDVLTWNEETTSAVMLVYTGAVGVVIAAAQVFTTPTTKEG